jgi:subtilisin family serine protease/membrane protease YdiL (CAAX protease family)
MIEPVPAPSRPGLSQWLLFFVLAGWLAAVPLAVTAVLSSLTGTTPDALVQLGVAAPSFSPFPGWAFGLLSTALALGLNLLLFVPLTLASRRPGREFVHATGTLLIAIVLFQTLNALARLPWTAEGLAQPASTPFGPAGVLAGLADPTGTIRRAYEAALRLAVVLPFLLLGLGWLEARRQGGSLVEGWRRVGLRLWLNPSAMWLALGAGAVVVGPWVLVGSLGSAGTTATNALQALPNALGEEILFRGFAFAWLWRTLANPGGGSQGTEGRTRAAAGSLLLFVAAQGGTVLPNGDWAALLRFGAALLLGLLAVELTVRAGSIWPAVVVHFVYDGFHLAFVDPRSEMEVLQWVVQVWAPLAAGGLGLMLWVGRKIAGSAAAGSPALQTRRRRGSMAAALAALAAWVAVLALYGTYGLPGFHPDGFLIVLEQQADLSPAASIADPVERRAWVYQTLVDTAESSQAPLLAELDRQGVPTRPHYLIDLIEVQERPGLRRSFAGQPGVASVLFQPGVRPYPRTFTLPNMDTSGPQGVEWNVQQIGADRVWGLGATGQGIVVGDADTGVTWDHPALKEAYLGWDGTEVDHNYHWYDPWDGELAPQDDNGHGTHTTGTMVGLDGENQIGVAPGARWIACRNMRHGIGNPGGYLSCMEFLLAPFPLAGDPFHDGAPARGAQVVNNSWGCPTQEGCEPDTLRIAVQNLKAAGQMMPVSAGNSGPACGTVEDVPATYEAVFTVGAVNQGERAAAFSSRGPVTVDGSQRPKPDIAAPGVDVRSAVPGGYASLSGTSMAGPHVAGAVALLWSLEPALIGDIDRTETILAESARPLAVDAVCPSGPESANTICACGGEGVDSVPNDVYGWGEVDVWAAAQSLLGGQ